MYIPDKSSKIGRSSGAGSRDFPGVVDCLCGDFPSIQTQYRMEMRAHDVWIYCRRCNKATGIWKVPDSHNGATHPSGLLKEWKNLNMSADDLINESKERHGLWPTYPHSRSHLYRGI